MFKSWSLISRLASNIGQGRSLSVWKLASVRTTHAAVFFEYWTALYIATLYCSVHCTVHYNIALHYTLLALITRNLLSSTQWAILHALYCTSLYCSALQCTTLHWAALHCTVLYCTALHCTALHCTTLHCTALHCTELQYVFWSIVALHSFRLKLCSVKHIVQCTVYTSQLTVNTFYYTVHSA